jgi:hypothetical protein
MSQKTYSILVGFGEVIVFVAGAAALIVAACIVL